MIYAFIGIITLIMLATFSTSDKLSKLLSLISILNDKISELSIDTKQINEALISQKIEDENINKKPIKELDIDYSSKNYMTDMYGYIEQTKVFSTSQITTKIGTIPCKNINEYIKQQYLVMFALMMKENNLKFEDFKVEHTYGGMGPSEHFFIKFELKDTKYFGWDEWVSKGTLIAEMKNGEVKNFEVESYSNNLEEYFETKSEYDKVHFFDALSKTYSSFSFDNESYRSTGGYSNDTYVIVINDLIEQYNYVGEKWNVDFATTFLDGRTGKPEDIFVNTNIIDRSWLIDEFQELQIVEWEAINAKREEVFNALQQSKDKDDRFKLATMYYYLQFNSDWNKEDGHYQREAIKIWSELAEENHAYSQLIMGILCFDGKYVLKNFSKSKDYLELAFKNGLESPSLKVWEDLKLYDY